MRKAFSILAFIILIQIVFCQKSTSISYKSDSISEEGYSIFLKHQKFQDYPFKQNTDFTLFKFTSIANFIGASFEKSAHFFIGYFNTETSFKLAEFNSYADFTALEFNDNTDFINTKFRDDVRFEKCYFNSTADFWAAKFYSKVYFPGTRFSGKAIFYETEFNSGFFSRAILPDILDFSEVKIINEVDFSWAISDSCKDGVCKINLYGSDIDKIKIDYNNFQLFFDSTLSFDQKSNVYTDLLARTKELGYENSYEKLDKEFKKFTYLEKDKDNPKKIMNWLDKNWWGYGYNKKLIFRNTLHLLLIFFLINLLALRYMLASIYSNDKINIALKELNFKYKVYSFLYYCYYTFVYVILIFFGLRFKLADLKYTGQLSLKKFFGLLNFFLMYIIGLVCLGHLANYIITY